MTRPSITDPRANDLFRKPAGVAFTTHSPRVDWARYARFAVEGIGLVGFLWLVCAAVWGASS